MSPYKFLFEGSPKGFRLGVYLEGFLKWFYTAPPSESQEVH